MERRGALEAWAHKPPFCGLVSGFHSSLDRPTGKNAVTTGTRFRELDTSCYLHKLVLSGVLYSSCPLSETLPEACRGEQTGARRPVLLSRGTGSGRGARGTGSSVGPETGAQGSSGYCLEPRAC